MEREGEREMEREGEREMESCDAIEVFLGVYIVKCSLQ